MASSTDAPDPALEDGPQRSLDDSKTGDPAGSQPPPARKRGLVRRIVLWSAFGLAGLLTLALASVVWLGAHLDHPSVKSRLRALLQENAQLAIDYDQLEISLLRGLRGRGLRVLQPARFRATAPDFLRIDALDVGIHPSALASGEHTIDFVHVGHVELTVVRDPSGATTLSELFPPASESAPQAKLSASLADLPSLAISRVALDGLSARLIELRAGALPRTTSFASLGLSGTLHSAAHSLRGTRLQLHGAPSLRLEMRDGEQVQFAALELALEARADAADALALRVRTDLGAQNLLPGWTGGSQLLDLDATISFAEQAARTHIACSDFHAVGRMLAASLALDLFDGEPMRLVASGSARVDIPRLPLRVPGMAVEGLTFALDAKQFAWQANRVAGAIDWRAGWRTLAFERAGQSLRSGTMSLTGRGAFEGPSGNLEASSRIAAITMQSAAGTAQIADVQLDVTGTTQQRAASQEAQVHLALASDSATLAGNGQTLELAGLRLSNIATGSIANFAAQLVPKLESRLGISRIAAADGNEQILLEGLAADATVQDLASDAANASGARGAAELAVALPSLRTFAGPASPRKNERSRAAGSGRRAALELADLKVRAQLPLSLERVAGELSLASLTARDKMLKALSLAFTAQRPLAWTGGAKGPAQVSITGHSAGVRADDSGAIVEDLRLVADRLNADHYRLELHSATSALVTAGRKVPGRVTMDVRADADLSAEQFALSAALRGARAAVVDLDGDAAFDVAAQRLRYRLSISAEKLDAFAPLLYEVAPSAAPVQVAGARLSASAQGQLAGVLRGRRGALPELAPHPLATVRGEQSSMLELKGLDYRSADGSLAIPELSFKLDSTHGEAGAGSAHTHFRAASLRYEGGGTALQLEGLTQQLTATFDRAPDRGLVDVHADLELASASQSLLPAYPIGGLRLAARMQVDRLRSIFLRELTLQNKEAGTVFSAQGALELRTASPRDDSQGERKTLVGREALALEGRFQQALEPLQKLGWMSRAQGTIELPFRLESGGLLGYRLLATLTAKEVSFATQDGAIAVEKLNGVVPLVEEFALLPGGPVLSSGPRASPLADTRFFDVHPFLSGDNYVTARSITLQGLRPLGPLAANMRLDRTDFFIDQLQVGFDSGQIVGQVRVAYRDGDPLVRMRLDATGLRPAHSNDVFDANASLSFVPKAMTLDGKLQLVRISRSHVLSVLDVVDPFHDSASANRVRRALALGYPKFVRFQMHDGAVDTKIDLGGLAQAVRIDEIKAVPLGPILQRYVAPTLATYLPAAPHQAPAPVQARAEELQ